MPKLRPAPAAKKEEIETEPTHYGSEGPEKLFESKDDLPEREEGEVVVDSKEEKEDPSLALKKQIEDLRKSEQLARDALERANREREDALRRANDREQEALRVKHEVTGTRIDAINAGIAAAQAEAETAQRDLEGATSIGDTKAQAEAYRKLARAEANLSKLEDGRAALLEEQERQKHERPVSHETGDELDKAGLPETAKTWLRAHPEYLKEPRKNAKIQALHWDIIDEGHQPFSQSYFESMEVHLGMRQKPKAEKEEEEEEEEVEVSREERKKGSVVSAPVSRDAPGNSRPTNPSQVRLTKAQVEAAKMAGVTPAEYAKQLIKLGEFKAEGHYGESR